MDVDMVVGFGEERIDGRFKGFPARFDGHTVASLIAARPALGEFGTPLLTLDEAALTHNIDTMARYCAERGVDLAPHGKTTMAPQLFARQLRAGAWGMTAATAAHVRLYRAFGISTVLLANELVDPDALRWVAAEYRRDPSFRLLCFADSTAGVEIMGTVLAGVPRPVDVLVELGWPGGRAGCRDLEEAGTVARAIRGTAGLRLAGVGGFEGALAHDRSPAGLAVVRDYLGRLRDLAVRLDAAGLFDGLDEIIVTAGGSAYFDDVVPLGPPVRTVLRSGAYITHDDGHYAGITPVAGAFRAALRLRGRVLSRPEPGLALLDFGKRDAPADLGLPRPLADGEGEITALADQHAFLACAPDAALAVGDIVTCGVSHPCTAFDKWRFIPVVADGHVIDVIRTYF